MVRDLTEMFEREAAGLCRFCGEKLEPGSIREDSKGQEAEEYGDIAVGE